MAHKDNIKNAENAAKEAQAVADGAAPAMDEPAAPAPVVKSVNQVGNSTGAVQIWPKVEPKAV